MGSVGNQNPWLTYDTYRDCSQGICSIYCPQWCYIIFPPPPPFSLSDDDAGSGTDFSPLIIAVIGILASAFILVSYYTIISKYCRLRSTSGHHGESSLEEWTNESWQGGAPAAAPGGLDESIIKSITVWKYKKSDGRLSSVDGGTDCSVCLTEFQENESLRLLPKCNHAFHLLCIDTWLKSNATCPLCRANILQLQPPQPQPPVNQETHVSVQEYQYRSNDSLVVVQELEQQEAAVIEVRENINVNTSDGIQPIRRSASLNLNSSSSSSSLCQNGNMITSIADVLQNNNEDDEIIRDMEIKKIGLLNLISSPLAVKRSISTGRFMFITSSFENGRPCFISN